MRIQKRASIAVALWTVSGAMAAMRSIWNVDWIGVWVVLLVGLAAIPTVWLIVQHCTEQVAKRAVDRLLESDQATLDKLADAIIGRRGSTPIR